MAYLYGQRHQNMLFPQSIDDYITEDDPVRAYDAFIDALDWDSLNIKSDKKKKGCPEYYPKSMLKVLVYGYSYGIRSSRKLERALHHNLSFIWLASGLKPDDRTIARFRRKNKKTLKQVFKQCARLCMKLGLIEGNTLFVDGSKIRANAGTDSIRTVEDCEKALEKLDQRIDDILKECDKVDRSEADCGSLVKLNEELAGKNTLKDKIKKTLDTLNSEDLKRINTTDPDCDRMAGRQGSHASYNAQIVVDEKHGLIVSNDVVNDKNDLNQFSNQIDQANEHLEEPCKTAIGDAGYSSGDDLAKIYIQGIDVIVPTSKQANNKELKPFDRTEFKYDSDSDCYTCPEGNILTKRGRTSQGNAFRYFAKKGTCCKCQHFGVCTKGKDKGRIIHRHDTEEIREKIAAAYEQESSKELFYRRKETVELPFGHIKRNLGAGHFLLRGFAGVRAEMSILSSCFNIVRLIGILGVPGLINELKRV